MVFRHLKKLTAALKTKAFANGQSQRNSTRNHASTEIAPLKRIMVFGDSNSFRPDGRKMCWPALLENKGSLHLRVFNESCDGRTTKYDNGERNGLNVGRPKSA